MSDAAQCSFFFSLKGSNYFRFGQPNQNCPTPDTKIDNPEHLIIGVQVIFTIGNHSAFLTAHNASGVTASGCTVHDALLNLKVIENLPLLERILARNQVPSSGNFFADHTTRITVCGARHKLHRSLLVDYDCDLPTRLYSG
jgi:hypothetical protein